MKLEHFLNLVNSNVIGWLHSFQEWRPTGFSSVCLGGTVVFTQDEIFRGWNGSWICQS